MERRRVQTVPSTTGTGGIGSASTATSSRIGPRAKCDQVVYEAIAKAAEIIVRSREAPGPLSNGSIGNYNSNSSSSSRFNFEIPEVNEVRRQLQPWRRSLHVPLRLDVYYEGVFLPSAEDGGDADVHGNVRERVLLERWCMDYVPDQTSTTAGAGTSVALDNATMLAQLRQVCKKIILALRIMHCFARMLPAYALHCQLLGVTRKFDGGGRLLLSTSTFGCGSGSSSVFSGFQRTGMAQQQQQQQHHQQEGSIGYTFYATSHGVNGDGGAREAYEGINVGGKDEKDMVDSSFLFHGFPGIPTPYGSLNIGVWYHPESESLSSLSSMPSSARMTMGRSQQTPLPHSHEEQFQRGQQIQRGQEVKVRQGQAYDDVEAVGGAAVPVQSRQRKQAQLAQKQQKLQEQEIQSRPQNTSSLSSAEFNARSRDEVSINGEDNVRRDGVQGYIIPNYTPSPTLEPLTPANELTENGHCRTGCENAILSTSGAKEMSGLSRALLGFESCGNGEVASSSIDHVIQQQKQREEHIHGKERYRRMHSSSPLGGRDHSQQHVASFHRTYSEDDGEYEHGQVQQKQEQQQYSKSLSSRDARDGAGLIGRAGRSLLPTPTITTAAQEENRAMSVSPHQYHLRSHSLREVKSRQQEQQHLQERQQSMKDRQQTEGDDIGTVGTKSSPAPSSSSLQSSGHGYGYAYNNTLGPTIQRHSQPPRDVSSNFGSSPHTDTVISSTPPTSTSLSMPHDTAELSSMPSGAAPLLSSSPHANMVTSPVPTKYPLSSSPAPFCYSPALGSAGAHSDAVAASSRIGSATSSPRPPTPRSAALRQRGSMGSMSLTGGSVPPSPCSNEVAAANSATTATCVDGTTTSRDYACGSSGSGGKSVPVGSMPSSFSRSRPCSPPFKSHPMSLLDIDDNMYPLVSQAQQRQQHQKSPKGEVTGLAAGGGVANRLPNSESATSILLPPSALETLCLSPFKAPTAAAASSILSAGKEGERGEVGSSASDTAKAARRVESSSADVSDGIPPSTTAVTAVATTMTNEEATVSVEEASLLAASAGLPLRIPLVPGGGDGKHGHGGTVPYSATGFTFPSGAGVGVGASCPNFSLGATSAAGGLFLSAGERSGGFFGPPRGPGSPLEGRWTPGAHRCSSALRGGRRGTNLASSSPDCVGVGGMGINPYYPEEMPFANDEILMGPTSSSAINTFSSSAMGKEENETVSGGENTEDRDFLVSSAAAASSFAYRCATASRLALFDSAEESSRIGEQGFGGGKVASGAGEGNELASNWVATTGDKETDPANPRSANALPHAAMDGVVAREKLSTSSPSPSVSLSSSSSFSHLTDRLAEFRSFSASLATNLQRIEQQQQRQQLQQP